MIKVGTQKPMINKYKELAGHRDDAFDNRGDILDGQKLVKNCTMSARKWICRFTDANIQFSGEF
uniref:Uncharacterized protein n=1 Tax=Romanomermis culicivorax TaxID=13658 RepID=A0A915HK22_ROMCU